MSFSVFGCRFGSCVLQQKYLVMIMVCLTMVVLYGSRYSTTASLHHILERQEFTRNYTEGEVCPDVLEVKHVHKIKVEAILKWTKGQQAYVKSSFFAGYILLHIPSGMCCDLYGAKHFLSTGVLCSGIANIIQAFILTTTPWYYTAILQFILGSVQGISMPAMFSLMSRWTPSHQITQLVACGYSGGCLGSMISALLSPYFLKQLNNWKMLFFFWATVIVIWYAVFVCFIFSHPKTHPFVSEWERMQMIKELGDSFPQKIPWKEILSDSAMWALVAGQVGHGYLVFMLDTNLPTFLKEIIGVNLLANPASLVIPYICEWVAIILFSSLGNFLISRGHVPTVYMRGIYTAVGNILPSALVVIAAYIGCNKILVTTIFAIAMACKGAIYAGLKTNIVDLSRHYAGVVTGLHNGLPSVTGIIMPQMIKFLCQRHTVYEWRKVFWMSFSICVFSGTLYFLFSKGERARWDTIDIKQTSRRRRVE